jgi:uncharacterized protein with HEPN domain
MKDDAVFIAQIKDASNMVVLFTNGMSREDFMHDRKTQSAVIMQLALIGELAKRVSTDTTRNIDLPWKDIAGFRDRAIHDYYNIDLEVVWNTIVEDIPMLQSVLADY